MGKLLQISNTVDKVPSNNKKPVATKAHRRFRLIHFKNKFFTPIRALENTRCTLEVYKAGLIVSGDFYENCNHISVLSEEILSIELIRGKETIDTFYLSPLHILSKIGLPNSVARHFRFHPTEYKISQTTIRIEAKEQELEFIASGYRFEKLLRSFKKLGYSNKLHIERKASVDLSGFKNIIPNLEKHTF